VNFSFHNYNLFFSSLYTIRLSYVERKVSSCLLCIQHMTNAKDTADKRIVLRIEKNKSII